MAVTEIEKFGNDAAGQLADDIMECVLAAGHPAGDQIRKDIAAGLAAVSAAGPAAWQRFLVCLADNFDCYNH